MYIYENKYFILIICSFNGFLNEFYRRAAHFGVASCSWDGIYTIPVEIYGIPYMKKVTEFSGILANSARNTEETEVKKQTEFRVDGIPWTPYSQCKKS